MRSVALLPVVAVMMAPIGAAADPAADAPNMLYNGSLLCHSAEVYQTAADAETDTVRSDLVAANECMRVTEDDLEEMLAPFVVVIEQRGELVRVQYSVEYEDKIELLHRKVAHVRYTGWTAEANLRNYHEWLTGKPQT